MKSEDIQGPSGPDWTGPSLKESELGNYRKNKINSFAMGWVTEKVPRSKTGCSRKNPLQTRGWLCPGRTMPAEGQGGDGGCSGLDGSPSTESPQIATTKDCLFPRTEEGGTTGLKGKAQKEFQRNSLYQLSRSKQFSRTKLHTFSVRRPSLYTKKTVLLTKKYAHER